ncbi:M16 family metallopeptidase [Prevotella sp.]|uniref:M16 family metallopeptidase n=1 Tax=Prevotella sp. TaxID=59823 RepID=UPI002F94E1D7
MKLRNLFVGALLLLAATAQAQMEATIPNDPDVRIGRLSNGLTYYIRHNNWPEHRANFYIAQKVGSIQEEENQRGLAHFLEHMAFNGSDNFKGNNLIEWCRSKGIEFGSDLNAYTGIDQTVYNIDNVPTTTQSTLDSCLLILRDWSTGLTLDPKEIDKERGVIHSEWRDRTSPTNRMFERNLPALYPGSKYGLRFPIGLMSVVDNFKPKELRDYYEKWYHPNHQGIFIVGDVDVDHTEAMIKKLFGNIKNPANSAPIVDEPVPDNAEPIVIIDKDKEYQQSAVEMMIKHDPFPDSLKNNISYIVYKFARNAAISMLNNRFVEAAQKEDCPFVGAGVSDDDYIFAKTKAAFGINAMPKDITKCADALQAAYMEVLRAVKFGFTATEFARYKANFESTLEKVYSNKDKRSNTSFFEEYKGHFLNNEPIPSIDYEYQTAKQILPMIPLEAINQILPELVPANDSNIVIVNFNNEKEGNVYPTRQQLVGAIAAARTAELTPYTDNVKSEPLIKQLPKAGKVKKEEKNTKFGYSKLTLSNGVRVILKKTDFKKDQVSLSGRGGKGNSAYGLTDYVNTKLFDDVIDNSGLGNFSVTELGKAMAGKIANASLSMSERMMNVSGSSTPKDVETMLQLVYLYFTDIRKDDKSFNTLMQQMEVGLKNRDLSWETAFGDSVNYALYDHSPFVRPLVLNDLKSVSYDRILQMAKERTANAAGWEFEIIGNFDEATIRPLICQYLGALPAKGKGEKGMRRINFTKKNVDNTFYRKMETPKANSYIFWLSQQIPYTLEKTIQMDMAGQVLSMVYLNKIREEAGAAYSCGAQGGLSISSDGISTTQLVGICPMKPEKKDMALSIMNSAVKELGESCDAEMLNKVKQLMLKQADDRLKTNGYWANIIYAYEHTGFDNHTNYKALVEAQTPAKVSAMVKELLSKANKVAVVILPEEIKK